ncbi:MAG: RNA methyltransferase [Cyclobacteriaceae bacterium]
MQGRKNILEVIQSDFQIHSLYVTEEIKAEIKNEQEATVITQKELETISTLQSNSAGLAVVYQKESPLIPVKNEYIIALDGINDPGNLGTIIRIADWYNLKRIVCSLDTVDCYNPKVINASMGSFTRVAIQYTDLIPFLNEQSCPVLAADMQGVSVYDYHLQKEGIIVMGNEANGISENVHQLVSETISIPRKGGAESLNVAIATAIICDNLFR